MIKISEFINGYKLAKDKARYVEPHITTKYVAFEIKKAHAKRVIDFSMYKEVNGRKIFWADTPFQYELFTMTVIQLYTDIDLTDGVEEDGVWLNGFNKLEEFGATGDIIKAIGADFQAFQTILKMEADDAMFNNSLVNWLDTKAEALDITLGTLSDAINKISAED